MVYINNNTYPFLSPYNVLWRHYFTGPSNHADKLILTLACLLGTNKVPALIQELVIPWGTSQTLTLTGDL